MNAIKRAATMSRPGAVFKGAQVNRTTDDWYPTQLSIDQALKMDLRLLRSRSRALERDNSYAAGYCLSLKDNVIGADTDGIGLQAMVRGADGRPDRKLNAHIEDRFCTWGMPEYASANGQESWADQQRFYVGRLPTDGEVLYRLLPGFDNPFGFAVEFLDPDQLDDTLNTMPDANGNEIRMGVEIDRWRRPIAYWLWDRPPSEPGRQRTRVPAAQLCHDFVKIWPGQTRGVPWFAPAMFAWKMLDGFTEAEIMQSRAAACTGGFFVSSGEDAQLWLGPDGKPVPDPQGDRLTMDLEPNSYRQLPPGMTYQGVDPTHPNSTYGEFEKAVLRMIAKPLGISYTTLSGNFENTNYSSGRMGLLPERDFFKGVARWVALRLHRRVYAGWLKQAALNGQLDLPSLEVSQYSAHRWQFRGWGWVDPLNDIQAKERMLRLGLTTRTQLAAEIGSDFSDNIDELAAEEQAAADANVDVSGVDGLPKQRAVDTPNDPNTTDAPVPAPARRPTGRLAALQLLAGVR